VTTSDRATLCELMPFLAGVLNTIHKSAFAPANADCGRRRRIDGDALANELRRKYFRREVSDRR
jgi:hypothetical protein